MSANTMNEKETIQQELSSISPKLAGLPKHSPYVAPDGYMEQAKLELIKPICLREMTVPENYFEHLPSKIIQHIKAASTKPKENPMREAIRMNRVVGWTAAASILIIAGIFSMINWSTENGTGEQEQLVEVESSQYWEKEMDQLEEHEIINYLEENGHDVEAALVASFSETNTAESEIDLLLSEEWLKHIEL
jgi:hypothetical protein